MKCQTRTGTLRGVQVRVTIYIPTLDDLLRRRTHIPVHAHRESDGWADNPGREWQNEQNAAFRRAWM